MNHIISTTDLNWVNDEIINFYMQLITEEAQTAKHLKKIYTFSTFFYPNIKEKGQQAVKRWTRKVDIFAFELLIIPIHLGNIIFYYLAFFKIKKKR